MTKSLSTETHDTAATQLATWRQISLVATVPLLVGAAVLSAILPNEWESAAAQISVPADLGGINSELESALQQHWQAAQVPSADAAEDLTVLRRLALALHGTVPSLEEIRRFERDREPDRLTRWTLQMLEDPRFADYFAERLARAFVGVDQGPFLIYRRDQFTAWLAAEIQADTPYPEIVRKIVSDQGLWTGEPATNFVTAAMANGDLDENKLAGRVVRAFLGQRIDCAQCHDHPFDLRWEQRHFEGLAAFFGQTKVNVVGVEDKTQEKNRPIEYRVEDRETLEQRVVEPGVPFGEQWLPQQGTRRERLAAWIVHPENERFNRAIANRIWNLMFGLPWSDRISEDDPPATLDDLPDPDPEHRDMLDHLAADFSQHDSNLKRLVLVISQTPAFRARSDTELDPETAVRAERAWAVFPLTRLRPEQVVGSILQASSLQTIDQNSHLITRVRRLISENDFIRQYGDQGESELNPQTGTIPQTLQQMNGSLVANSVKANLLNAAASICSFSTTAEQCTENAFLTCLCRRPTASERDYYIPEIEAAKNARQRRRVVEDLIWTLFNSPEFIWNH